MWSARGGAIEDEEAAALEGAVDDGLGQVVVVEDGAPGGERRLVGGEEDRAPAQVAVVDDVEQHVGGVGPIGEVADLVDDEDVRMDVLGERLPQAAIAAGGGEIVDELGGGGEERRGAVLDGAVGDRDREMRLPAAGLAHEDQIAPLGDELGAEVGAEELQAHGRLERKVEVIDGLEEREVRVVDGASETGLLTVSDLLGDEHGKEVAAGPLLGLGSLAELAPDAPGVGEVKALEQRLEIDGAGIEGEISRHQGTSAGKRLGVVCGRPRHSATKAVEMRPTSRAARKARFIASGPTCWSISCSSSTSRAQAP